MLEKHPSGKEVSDLKDRTEVCEILEKLSLTTTEVLEADTKRCDFHAIDGEGEHYLIEVKGFHDNDNLRKALLQDDVHVGTRSLVRSNIVEEKIEYAVKQFQATPKAGDALWLVALMNRTAYGPDATTQQIQATLYGMRRIVYVDNSGRDGSSDCLYFSHSAFHRHPELDGAIVIDQSGVWLCLNDFGCRIDRVRKSALGRSFVKQGALNDAGTLESNGGFFLADCELDRKDDHAVLDYVKDKYCLEYAMIAAPSEHSATASVARPRPGSNRIE